MSRPTQWTTTTHFNNNASPSARSIAVAEAVSSQQQQQQQQPSFLFANDDLFSLQQSKATESSSSLGECSSSSSVSRLSSRFFPSSQHTHHNPHHAAAAASSQHVRQQHLLYGVSESSGVSSTGDSPPARCHACARDTPSAALHPAAQGCQHRLCASCAAGSPSRTRASSSSGSGGGMCRLCESSAAAAESNATPSIATHDQSQFVDTLVGVGSGAAGFGDPIASIWSNSSQQSRRTSVVPSDASLFASLIAGVSGTTFGRSHSAQPITAASVCSSPQSTDSLHSAPRAALSIGSSSLSAALLSVGNLRHSSGAPIPKQHQLQQQQQQHHTSSLMSFLSQVPPPSLTGPPPMCASCTDASSPDSKEQLRVASAFCTTCRDLLCKECVDAHGRVKLTRSHQVLQLDALVVSPQTWIGGAGGGGANGGGQSTTTATETPPPLTSSMERTTGCARHGHMEQLLECSSCANSPALCAFCLRDHSGHQVRLLATRTPVDLGNALHSATKSHERTVANAHESVLRCVDRLDASAQACRAEIGTVFHQLVAAVEERRRDVLARLELVIGAKKKALVEQADRLAQHLQTVRGHLSAVDADTADSYTRLLELFQTQQTAVRLDAVQTDQLSFLADETNVLLHKLRSLGTLESGVCASTSGLVGDSWRRIAKDRLGVVHVQLRDAAGQPSALATSDQPHLRTQLVHVVQDVARQQLPVRVESHEHGVYALSFTPTSTGPHRLDVTMRGLSLRGFPLSLDVLGSRDYAHVASKGPLFSFGGEGAGDGQLCRPWGICCDAQGRILVADRSNNRIQVFDADGRFLSKFGSAGTRPGEFDRPAGICTNTIGQVIVADKDNHRVQVFTLTGEFVLLFGERGRSPGQFNYPWGVASDSRNQIAVSDTRNHRVQIFTSLGQYVRKCAFDSCQLKQLDSPRGLVFNNDGILLVTDFNTHRLTWVSLRGGGGPPASSSSSMGPAQSLPPTSSTPSSVQNLNARGSSADEDGNWMAAGGGQAPGQFCRPQGICLDADGYVLVCDSRNNRVQVLTAFDQRPIACFGGRPTPNAKDNNVPPPPQPLLSSSSSSSSAIVGPSPYSMGTAAMAAQLIGLIPPHLPPSSTATTAAPTSSASLGHNNPNELDRPTDICIGPNGRIYVVDFGHNCVRVY